MSGRATRRARRAITTLLLAAAALPVAGCASRGRCDGDGYEDVACRTQRAHDALVFGLSRDQALAQMGSATPRPPWFNDLGAGPSEIHNPYDSFEVTSALGEKYEVVRFFVAAYGDDDCPFIQGRLAFEPLIFLGDELVGWRWSYLEDIAGRPVKPEETTWRFGVFCNSLGRPDETGPDATGPEAAGPDAAGSDTGP